MREPDRTLIARNVHVESFDPVVVGKDPVTWLAQRSVKGMILLAHADDGVIWAVGEDKQITQAPDVLFNDDFEKTKFRNETLQKARLFNATSEIFLWRIDEGRWRARLIIDDGNKGDAFQTLDEDQVLWGTRVEKGAGDFCRVADGQEGFRHTPPLILEEEDWGEQATGQERRLRLKVRHYLQEDETTGWRRITMSRLIEVNATKETTK